MGWWLGCISFHRTHGTLFPRSVKTCFFVDGVTTSVTPTGAPVVYFVLRSRRIEFAVNGKDPPFFHDIYQAASLISRSVQQAGRF